MSQQLYRSLDGAAEVFINDSGDVKYLERRPGFKGNKRVTVQTIKESDVEAFLLYLRDEHGPSVYDEEKDEKMITLETIDQALTDERHLGWGLACLDQVQDETIETAAREAIVEVANELQLTYDEFFHWTNSKLGRWLSDELVGNTIENVRPLVVEYLTANKVATAQAQS